MRILQWEQFDEAGRRKAGDEAEKYVRQVISSYGDGTLLRGPLVPHIDNFGRVDGFRETDFIVYTQGTVFCVEVKNYAGTISYLPLSRSQQSSTYGQHNGVQGYDSSKILQVKQGKRGELTERVYSNPLKKTKSFIGLLKRYVGRIEPRFNRLFLVPVACFDEQADISGIYNFEEGMITIGQIPAFFAQHRNEYFAARPSPWIAETILHKIPNWDRVLTTRNEWVNGILVEPNLTFVGLDGRAYTLANYAQIKEIAWQHAPKASYSRMTIIYTNGASQTYDIAGGQLGLIRGNQNETYPFRDLQRLVVGLANKMVL